MEWEKLVEATAESAGRPTGETRAVLDAFIDTLAEVLKQDDFIGLRRDFGVFKVRESGGEAKSEHRPQLVKKQRTVMFKAAIGLQKRLRQSDEEYLEMLEAQGAHAQAEQIRRKLRESVAQQAANPNL